jgi:hypothetical protein
MKKGSWRNGKRVITGWWNYHWASDAFVIILDQKDRITGDNKRILVKGETPEWGNWSFVREAI